MIMIYHDDHEHTAIKMDWHGLAWIGRCQLVIFTSSNRNIWLECSSTYNVPPKLDVAYKPL